MEHENEPQGAVVEERATRAVAAGRKLRIRTLIAIGVLAASGFLIGSNLPLVLYYLGPHEARDLGDVRTEPASGQARIDAEPGSYIKASNLLVTKRREGNFGNYFFCPASKMLVRTPRELPQISERDIEADVPAWLEHVLTERKAMPEDFSIEMAVEGRLVRLRDMPGFSGAVGDYVRINLRLSDDEIDRSFGLLDGDVPDAHFMSLLVVLASLFVSLLSLASLGLAWRTSRRLAKD